MPVVNDYEIEVTIKIKVSSQASPAAAAVKAINDLNVDESQVTSIIAIKV